EIILLFVGKHPPFQQNQDFRGFLVLPRGNISVREFKKLSHTVVFFPEKPLQQPARSLQASRSHQRVAIGDQKSRVTFGRRKRLEQGGGAHGISGLDVCLGVQQRHAAFLRRQFVRAPKNLHRIRGGAASRSELPGPQKRPR